jgi:nucleoside-diphosphate-sugar epimerase
MKIFITGFNGFIGKNLTEYYRDIHEVYFHHKNSDLLYSLSLYKPDIILHCAAEIYDTSLMWKSNVELTKLILEYCVRNNTKLIHFGSSSEYGIVNVPSYESMPLDVSTLYATTKGISTLLCTGYAKEYNLDLAILRPYSPYGPYEKSHRLFPKLWKSFKLNEHMILKQGMHDFLYIDDLLKAVDLLLNRKNNGEIYNVSSGEQYSNSDVLHLFRKITGHQGNVEFIDEMTTPPTWIADISKIKRELGWSPSISLESGIRSFLSKANYE